MTTLRLSLLLAGALSLSGCATEESTSEGENSSTQGNSADGAADAGSHGARPAAEAGDLPAPDDVAAPPADAKKTASGLAWKVLTAGEGTEHPSDEATVEVHYTGWTTDGKMFDNSVTRGETAAFPLNRVIPGWTEGLQLMVVGERTRFWIPVEQAYNNMPGRPAGMLVFDVELLGIE